MVGSKNKKEHVMTNLQQKGISKEVLGSVYAPGGLKLGGETPMDIAFSILAEIQLT
ncbi:XdhC family protein [Geosporobacter subterraneus]|nr:XdhC family protein [Geosporobacter subterraneus]